MHTHQFLIRATIKDMRSLLVNLGVAIGQSILIILQAGILVQIIRIVFTDHGTIQNISGLLIWLVIILLFRGILSLISETSAKALALRVKDRLRDLILAKISRLGPVYTFRQNRGDLIQLVFDHVEALDAYFSQFLPQVILAAITPIAILIAVFPREPLSGLVFLLTAPLIPVFMILIGVISEKRTRTQWALLNRLSNTFHDTIQGIELIKLLNQVARQEKLITNADNQYRQATMQVLRYTFLSALTLELVATISTAILAVELGLRLLSGSITFEIGLYVLVLAPEFYFPLRQVGVKYHAAMAGLESAKQIISFITDAYHVVDKPEVIPEKSMAEIQLDRSIIRFEHVSARYPGEQNPALQDVSFNIHPGEHIALVGETGSGKTTLTYLLLKFLLPEHGQIMIGEHALNTIPTEPWRKLIAWVPQIPTIFQMSLFENITLGAESPDRDRALHALEAAQLQDWVNTLPQGISTQLAERGSNISAGQRQRIALARAWYQNAPLLILDEPTSALDVLLERQLAISLGELVRNRTVITIAHRLQTVIGADRILVLSKGHLIETGTHHELLSAQGQYWSFVQKFGVAGE